VAGGDAEQGAEGGVPGAAAVEAEDELIARLLDGPAGAGETFNRRSDLIFGTKDPDAPFTHCPLSSPDATSAVGGLA